VNKVVSGKGLAGACLLSVMLAFAGFTFVYILLDLNQAQLASLTTPKIAFQSLRRLDGEYRPASLSAASASGLPSPEPARTIRTAATQVVPLPPAALALPSQPPATATLPAGWAELQAFTRNVADGRPSSLCGLYVAGVLALRVVQQPANDPSYISKDDGTATQFQKADPYGGVGLLAHNTLAGRDFFKLSEGQDLVLVYGDGHAEHFLVSEIADYQRLTLADLRSDFLSLATDQQQTADQIFAKYYEHANRLTLQTCLRRGDVADWGVRFVVADPSQPSQ